METDKNKAALPPTPCRDTVFRWGQRTFVMGILNLSPDSFSGDGLGDDVDAAIGKAKQMVEEGADIVDVGGESTRPGSQPILLDEELRLVMPVIERLTVEVPVPISIDTYKAEVARRSLKAGANMINDVWGLQYDPKMAGIVAEAGVPVVLVSNQRGIGHFDIMAEVQSSLSISIGLAEKAGTAVNNIIIDPGIGFGKSQEQNMQLISRLTELKSFRKPILLGTSRKFGDPRVPGQKQEANAVTASIGIRNGADIIRVHDVKEMVAVAREADAEVRKAAK